MARKYLAVNKNGNIGAHAIKGGRNLRENYVKVARFRGRNVYAKKGSGFENEGRTYITPPKKGGFRLIDFVPPERGGGGGGPGPKPPPEPPEGLVEVTGLVSVNAVSDGIAKGKNSSFHAEMLFFWYGRPGFNEGKLLDLATEILIETLPELERISFELASCCAKDQSRGGIEQVKPYGGQKFNEMEFEIFIPRVGGRVLTTGNARVSL